MEVLFFAFDQRRESRRNTEIPSSTMKSQYRLEILDNFYLLLIDVIWMKLYLGVYFHGMTQLFALFICCTWIRRFVLLFRVSRTIQVNVTNVINIFLHFFFLFFFFVFDIAFYVGMAKQLYTGNEQSIGNQSHQTHDEPREANMYAAAAAAAVPMPRANPSTTTDQYHHRETIWRVLIDAISLIIRKSIVLTTMKIEHLLNFSSSDRRHGHFSLCGQTVYSGFLLFGHDDSISVQRQHHSDVCRCASLDRFTNNLGIRDISSFSNFLEALFLDLNYWN